MGVSIVPNRLPIVELSIAIAYNSNILIIEIIPFLSPVLITSLPPIARTTKAAVDTGDGNVPNAFILKISTHVRR